jgi:hypothetical protein
MHDLKGFKVASGEPDIRGWDVCTLTGADVGEVDDLLVDPRRGEVVMIAVDLKGTGRSAEVPLRAVQLDRTRKVVVVDSGDVGGYTIEGSRGRLSDDDRDRLQKTYGTEESRDLRYDLRDETNVSEADRDRMYAERERALEQRERDLAERERKLSGGSTVHETVVDRKPVEVEETVVRRRRLAADTPDSGDLDNQ